jgi:hypothetical protein
MIWRLHCKGNYVWYVKSIMYMATAWLASRVADGALLLWEYAGYRRHGKQKTT